MVVPMRAVERTSFLAMILCHDRHDYYHVLPARADDMVIIAYHHFEDERGRGWHAHGLNEARRFEMPKVMRLSISVVALADIFQCWRRWHDYCENEQYTLDKQHAAATRF